MKIKVHLINPIVINDHEMDSIVIDYKGATNGSYSYSAIEFIMMHYNKVGGVELQYGFGIIPLSNIKLIECTEGE